MSYLQFPPRAAIFLVAAVLVLVGTTGVASAHASLKSSNPADNAKLDKAPDQVKLVFSESINADFVKVVVSGPDGAKVNDGSPRVKGATLTQPLTGKLAGGRYSIAFRVVSSDGHPISQQLHFTVKAAPSPAPTPDPTEQTSPPVSASPSAASVAPSTPGAAVAQKQSGSGVGSLIGVGVAFLVIAAGAVVFAVTRRRAASPR
ncbi:copper resistance CopC family protein [Sphaerisporangium perillae]|uniref:copper resistance CopC family protein n=1 Tax=Sphaerisporangium perillae TaxID=2935860 RepID=UPI00200BF51E|nr:copper resistance CopC family protein [Sphaerisporangium perillae]